MARWLLSEIGHVYSENLDDSERSQILRKILCKILQDSATLMLKTNLIRHPGPFFHLVKSEPKSTISQLSSMIHGRLDDILW
jgi:hypothetical protein